jgi:hypothetical protein
MCSGQSTEVCIRLTTSKGHDDFILGQWPVLNLRVARFGLITSRASAGLKTDRLITFPKAASVGCLILRVFNFEQTQICKPSQDAWNTSTQGSAMGNVHRTDKSFDPEATNAMGAAFDSAWQDLEASGNIFGPKFTADWARKTIATRIINMVHRGERDPDRLSDDALAYLAHALPPMADSWPAVVANRAAIETELRQLGAV